MKQQESEHLPFLCRLLQTLPLRQQILIPFFVILVLVGVAATVGSSLLIGEALTDTADERLLAFEEVLYREVKKQEILLSTYARIIDYTQHVSLSNDETGELAMLQDQLYASLSDAHITVAYYPANLEADMVPPGLGDLFDQTRKSGKPRFRFVVGEGVTPALTVAVQPLDHGNPAGTILLLQTPMTETFLKQLALPFNAEASLLGMDGEMLIASEQASLPPTLASEELKNVLTGKRVFKTLDREGTDRFLFYAVPLGTTDLVILVVSLPLNQVETLIGILAKRSLLTIIAALIIGSFIYYRLIRRTMTPIRDILEATEAVGQGEQGVRIREMGVESGKGELGRLAKSFNRMMARLEHLYADKVEQERVITLANEELKFKEILEQKNQEIERTNSELKSNLRELSALFQLNKTMSSTLDLNVLFDRILQTLKELIEVPEMVLLLYNQGGEELGVRKTVGLDEELLEGVSFRLNEGITGLAARGQELIYLPDVRRDDRFMNYKGKVESEGSFVSSPLVVKKRLVGVLNLHKDAVGGFSESEIKLIQAASNQLAIAIENAQLYEKTRELSNTDELTGLSNRRYFQEILMRELAQARRYHANFSLIMIDIDHFKRYNDTHGHLNGDIVLRKVASLLLQSTRGIDLVSRFGGEEFVILLPKTSREGARAAAEKLRQCVAAEKFTGMEQSQPLGMVTLSLGVSEFPNDSKDIYELLDLADRALYLAKENGRNRTVVWGVDFPEEVLSESSVTA